MIGGGEQRRWLRVGVGAFDDEGSCAVYIESFDVFHATFTAPDLTIFFGLADLDLKAAGLRLSEGRVLVECVVISDDGWCHSCGARGVMVSWIGG